MTGVPPEIAAFPPHLVRQSYEEIPGTCIVFDSHLSFGLDETGPMRADALETALRGLHGAAKTAAVQFRVAHLRLLFVLEWIQEERK